MFMAAIQDFRRWFVWVALVATAMVALGYIAWPEGLLH
jgi:hypothetical protein